MNTDEQEIPAFYAASEAYWVRFGYYPIGINYPELTVALLQAALDTGNEIEPLPIPDGADS